MPFLFPAASLPEGVTLLSVAGDRTSAVFEAATAGVHHVKVAALTPAGLSAHGSIATVTLSAPPLDPVEEPFPVWALAVIIGVAALVFLVVVVVVIRRCRRGRKRSVYTLRPSH